MPRPEKVQAVAEIKERLEQANAVFLAEYAGLSVAEQQDLRRGLRGSGAEFKVVKMTLARRAAAELNLDALDDLLLGPTGLAFADDDAVVAAKALKDFAASHEVFAIKGGLLGTEFLTPERVAQLADIEPREVLLARIAGIMKAPMANMAGLMAALPRGFATALQQLIDRGGDDSTGADPATASDDETEESPAAASAAPDAAASAESEAETAEEEDASAEGTASDDTADAPAEDSAVADAAEEGTVEPPGEGDAPAPEDSGSSDDSADGQTGGDSEQETDDDDEAADKAEEE